MGDGLKICKDKRHRSSSSIAGGLVEGTRSERKIDVRASIPEVDDHFAIAESRCNDLQEKIDMVKLLKRKKKLKKRSTTRVTEPSIAEPLPFISVRTQPKKKVSQQAARLRRLEAPANPTRGYLDSATVEQHDMLGHVRGYNQMYSQLRDQYKNKQSSADHKSPRPMQGRRTRPDGDGVCGQGVQINTNLSSQDVACGENMLDEYSDSETYEQRLDEYSTKKQTGSKKQTAQTRVRHDTPRETTRKIGSPQPKSKNEEPQTRQQHQKRAGATNSSSQKNRRATVAGNQITIDLNTAEDRPVVELFHKGRDSPSPTSWQRQSGSAADPPGKINKKGYEQQRCIDDETGPLGDAPSQNTRKEVHRHPRRVRYRSRRYELPTVASQMKQAGMRCYYGTTNHTNIPFVVSKSTAPSHNIGVNIQQVLNGLKIQQPLSGIPLTIAHHMGLGHIPLYNSKAIVSGSLECGEMNAIRLGRRLVRLPSYKCMSYSRMLALYRQGDGMVPRFLRAIARPHYFYTSMYNLVSNREDVDGATSKGRAAGSQEARASMAEYTSLYRDYEQMERALQERYDPELERRKDALARQLAAREEHIRKVVEEYNASVEPDPGLRASASVAEEPYRQSTFHLNADGPHP